VAIACPIVEKDGKDSDVENEIELVKNSSPGDYIVLADKLRKVYRTGKVAVD
jgi:hypothetical protein